MVLFGTIINGLCIIIGSIFGLFFTNIPERFKETVMHGIGRVVLLIGIQMAFSTEVIIIVLLSIMFGAIIGELLHVEERLNSVGHWIGSKFTSSPNTSTSISQGFVTATLVFVMGAMSILGSLDSGIRGDHELLVTKGIIDGFVSIVLTTTLGFGVIFSVIPVVLYQGTITLFATQIEKYLPEAFLTGFITELTAVGGIIIIAIGVNLLKILHIRIGNLLPSLVMVGIIYYIYYLF